MSKWSDGPLMEHSKSERCASFILSASQVDTLDKTMLARAALSLGDGELPLGVDILLSSFDADAVQELSYP